MSFLLLIPQKKHQKTQKNKNKNSIYNIILHILHSTP